MNGWLAKVGLPLTSAERAIIGELVGSAVPGATVAITALASWREAADFLRMTADESTWWDQQEEERELLWTRAAERWTESDLLDRVNAMTPGMDAQVRAAASAAAVTSGVTDASVANEATGMALLAAHQSALAEMAGATPGHWFVRNFALWKGGRWPLGYHSARFAIF